VSQTNPPEVALLLVDVINDMAFEGSESLVRQAEAMAPRLRALKARARAAGLPTIYVNDNFGKWRSDFRAIVDHCLNDDVPGQHVARALRPDDDDYFVLKPMQSAFYGTTLDILLRRLGIRGVILTGIAGNNCILFSAHDAYMRDLRLWVPGDCVVSNTEAENEYALGQMATVTKADIRPSTELPLDSLAKPHASHPDPAADSPSRRQ
jgi:nicotinamidase-related amidase